jgi:hypothetical protein
MITYDSKYFSITFIPKIGIHYLVLVIDIYDKEATCPLKNMYILNYGKINTSKKFFKNLIRNGDSLFNRYLFKKRKEVINLFYEIKNQYIFLYGM